MANFSRQQSRIENILNYWIWLGVILVLSSCSMSHAQDRPSSTSDRSSPTDKLETGIALARKGDLKGAEEAFERAVVIQPKDARALTALGQVQEQEGKLPDSIAIFHKVIGLDPPLPDAHVNLENCAVVISSELAASSRRKRNSNSLDTEFVRSTFSTRPSLK